MKKSNTKKRKIFLQALDVVKGLVLHIAEPDSDVKHAYFVISNPDPCDCVMLVNMTTAITPPPGCDTRYLLQKGEHQAVKHQSIIAYHFAKAYKRGHLAAGVNCGVFTLDKAIASPQLIKKIQDGAREDLDLPVKFLQYFPYF